MNDNIKKYIPISIAVFLFLILAIVLIWFVVDLNNLHRSGALRAAHSFSRRPLAGSPILQIGQIQGWMTFSYINYIFRLPANYLSGKLDIADTAYPNFTLDKYASAHKLDQATFLESVKQAAAAYVSGGGK